MNKFARILIFLKSVAWVGRRAAGAGEGSTVRKLVAELPHRLARETGDTIMKKQNYHIPKPNHIRKIEKSFAWLDHRLMRSGYLAVMDRCDQGLYLFLVLAADRNGVSFYRKEKICNALGMDFQEFEIARDRLVEMQLIAFQPYTVLTPNGFYQVLPVDGKPPEFGKKVTDLLTLKNVDV